jgi:hypothetical protein
MTNVGKVYKPELRELAAAAVAAASPSLPTSDDPRRQA